MKIKELQERFKTKKEEDTDDMFVEGDIIDAEIQRNLIWKQEYKKELIESILENQPIGVITLFKETGKDYLQIIDGKQRIYAIESFWNGTLFYDNKNIDKLSEKEEEIFWNYEINIQYAEGDFKAKCKLFEKINKNMEPLKPFELLRAQFYGKFILGLHKYVKTDISVLKVFKTKKNDRWMNEIVVLDVVRGHEDRNDFLRQRVEKKDGFNKYIEKPRKIFDFIADVFTSYADIKILIQLAEKYQNNKPELSENREKLNNDIINMRESINWKYLDKLSQYERIIDRYTIEKDKVRGFSKQIKDHLWNSDDEHLCQLCLFPIDNYDNAEVDHKKAWINGGQTNLENAQIAHRTCNRIKGKK